MAEFDVDAILADTNTRLAAEYVQAFGDYLVAVVLRNAPQTRDARLRLEEVVRESMGRAEVLGALSSLRAASGVIAGDPATAAAFSIAPGSSGLTGAACRGQLLAFADTSAEKVLSRVTFAEALEDLVDRVPVTLRNTAERISGRIAELYAADGGVIAFANSAEAAVTQRARELITKGVREGIPEREIGRTIAFDVNRIRRETEAWTESYARMAFRTNLNDAVSQGRIRTAQDPDVKIAIPAFRFTAIGDGDTRPNHKAADGIILSVDNPAWRWLRSPLGYNCRCGIDNMSRPLLRRMGRLDAAGNVVESKIPFNARPDEGFRPGGGP